MFVPCIIRRSRNNQHHTQTCATALFIYAGSHMFRQEFAIFRELLDPSELRENTDRYGGLSYSVVRWPVCRSVVVQSAHSSIINPSQDFSINACRYLVSNCSLCCIENNAVIFMKVIKFVELRSLSKNFNKCGVENKLISFLSKR
jgi:hypothetical protein